MKKLLLVFALVSVFRIATALDLDDPSASQCVFNWTNPASLNPPYPAPDASNRYGEYISNVTFKTDAGPNSFYLTIDDSDVKEQSQRARFLFGYNTQKVEMRAYVGSVITVSTEKNGIQWIEFTGPKVDDNYLECISGNFEYKEGKWELIYGKPMDEVRFYVLATINCFTTECMHAMADVSDIVVDSDDDSHAAWYTLDGRRLAERPSAPGLYIRRGATAAKVLVRQRE